MQTFFKYVTKALLLLAFLVPLATMAQKTQGPRKSPRKIQADANKKKEDQRKAELEAYEDFRKQNRKLQKENDKRENWKNTRKRMRQTSRKAKRVRKNKKAPFFSRMFGHRLKKGKRTKRK